MLGKQLSWSNACMVCTNPGPHPYLHVSSCGTTHLSSQHSRGRSWRIRNSRLFYAIQQVRSQPRSMTQETVQGGSRPQKQCWGGRGQAPVSPTKPGSGQHSSECQLFSTFTSLDRSSGWAVTVSPRASCWSTRREGPGLAH